MALKAEVKRDGTFVSIDAETVVPGDVFRVTVGDIIPADALVLEASAFTANEAALTGEPYGVDQAAGRGEGDRPPRRPATPSSAAPWPRPARRWRWRSAPAANTLFGEAAKSLNAAAEISPFQRDLRQLGFLVARATGVLVVGVLAANVAFGRPLIQSLMFSVALAVGLTPELLPMITTVTLSRGAVRMSRKKVIVKRLAAIHDLGAMTVLCTDKTGTLTSAEIELAGSLAPGGKPDERPAMLAADLRQPRRRQGIARQALTKARPDAANGWTRRGLLPFDYQRRMGAVLADGPEGLTLIVKGAPEAVLAACASAAGAPFDAAARKAAMARVQALAGARAARRGDRLAALVRRAARSRRRTTRPASSFEGLCTFADPPKASAPAAVARLAAAGVRVVILSGDDPLVVGRLAKIVGLRAQQVITGTDLDTLSDRRPAGAEPATPTSSPACRPIRRCGSSMPCAPPARWWGSWATASTTRRASRPPTSAFRWTAPPALRGRRPT